MSPLPQHQLSRRTISSEERYTVAFAVLGSVILACGVLWGYFIPKWRKKRERPVPTRYNCIGNGNNPKANRKVDSEHDLELPVIFPPHPAVVVPLSKKAESNAQPRVYNHTSILVYNPQIQSPFPNTPRPAVCRPLASEVLTKTVPPPSKAKSLHSARVQQSQPRIAAKSIHRLPLPTTPNPFQRQRIGNLAQHNNTKGDKRSLLVPRPAGAPPAKPPTARLASAKSKHEIPIWEDPVQLSSSPPNLISIGDYKNLKQGQGRAIASHPPGVQNKSANEISNSMNQSACTPAQASPGIRNIFETPSSLETCTTSRLDSFVKHGHAEFTPPTAPGSSALQIEVNNLYPGATKLVPSRRFKDYVPALKKTATPSTDTILEGSSTLLEEVHDSHQVPRDGNRPTSGNFTRCFYETLI